MQKLVKFQIKLYVIAMCCNWFFSIVFILNRYVDDYLEVKPLYRVKTMSTKAENRLSWINPGYNSDRLVKLIGVIFAILIG